ncbi:MAG: hypothetical protein ACRC5T_11090 [Cetobacterium sp.]
MRYAIYNKNIPLPDNKVFEGLFDEVMTHLKNEFGDVNAKLINETVELRTAGE